MGFLKTILSVLLAVDKKTAEEIIGNIRPKVEPIVRFMSRLCVFIIFFHCLYKDPSAAFLIAILTYFVGVLETRVDNLEAELNIEKKVNREAYSTERYNPKIERLQ